MMRKSLSASDFQKPGLISVYEMLFFLASHFVRMMTLIETLRTAAQQDRNDTYLNIMDPKEAAGFESLAEELDRMELISAKRHLNRFIEKGKRAPVSFQEVLLVLTELQNRVTDELSESLCFIVPKVDADRYFATQPPLFGHAVANNFPSAAFDIYEAGRCMALDRHTAAVFHLGRAVEVGMKVLARHLGVTESVPSWDGVLGKIDAQLSLKYAAKDSDFRGQEDFFAEAALHVRNYKNSRNNTMHADKKYTQEEAERIFTAVRSLMQQLATELKEKDYEQNGTEKDSNEG